MTTTTTPTNPPTVTQAWAALPAAFRQARPRPHTQTPGALTEWAGRVARDCGAVIHVLTDTPTEADDLEAQTIIAAEVRPYHEMTRALAAATT